MKTIEVRGRVSSSRILVGERLGNLPRTINPGRTIVISDRNVHRLYAADFPASPLILVESGESAKTLETVRDIYRELLGLGADRSSFLLGIGGGVVCDITGFAAGTYMRGLRFGFAATTLLCQADACLGGKSGVNFDGFKNIVGVFNQPEFVVCDPRLLRTLPEEEAANGFAELIKHGLVGSGRLLETLERRSEEALAFDPELAAGLVYDSLRVKASVVRRDEREAGPRKILNFGHTLGHALEKTRSLSHGRAVALGMVFALRLSRKRGVLKDPSLPDRLARLLGRYRLPAEFEGDPGDAIEAMVKDKKKAGEAVDFVLLKEIGRPVLERIPLSVLKEEALDLCQSPRA